SVGTHWGHKPSVVEVVPATITLPAPARAVSVHALDPGGQLGAALEVTGDTTATFDIGPEQATLWYEIAIGDAGLQDGGASGGGAPDASANGGGDELSAAIPGAEEGCSCRTQRGSSEGACESAAAAGLIAIAASWRRRTHRHQRRFPVAAASYGP